MSDYLLVSTTTETGEQARRLARRLVERRLAACVQVLGPIESTYRWRGEVESSAEWLCIVKTRAERFAQVRDAIAEAHPYEVPEIVAAPLVAGSEAYLAWIDASLREG